MLFPKYIKTNDHIINLRPPTCGIVKLIFLRLDCLGLDSLNLHLVTDYWRLPTALQELKQEVQQKWNSDHAGYIVSDSLLTA